MKKTLVVGTLLSLFYLGVQAQVTIGTDAQPTAGALLDLKQTTDLGTNAKKGLGLPRVELTDLTKLQPMYDYSSNAPTAAEIQAHIGLVVYHVGKTLECDSDPIPNGVYVWDGMNWLPIFNGGSNAGMAEGVGIYEDNRTYPAETYYYRDFGPAGIWMTENMRATTYDTNAGAPQPVTPLSGPRLAEADDAVTPYWLYPHYLNDGTLSSDYFDANRKAGLLYNWSAATGNQNTSTVDQSEGEPGVLAVGVQGICPQGWHLPSDVEWNLLEKEIAENPEKYSSNTGTTWEASWATDYGDRPKNSNATNGHGVSMTSVCPLENITVTGKSNTARNGGFDAQLIGYSTGGYRQWFGQDAAFWTASSGNSTGAFVRRIGYGESGKPVGVSKGIAYRETLRSVRCKKD